MTLAEYAIEVKRTCPDLGTEQLNILHMVLGLNSEFDELYQAKDDVNRGEELTDINWYLNNYCNIKNIDLWRIFEPIANGYFYINQDLDYIAQLQVAISKLTDLEKKAFAYKKVIDREKYINAVSEVAMRLFDCYVYFDVNPYQAMKNNIDKLYVRFPAGFNEHDANNRKLEQERKELEK